MNIQRTLAAVCAGVLVCGAALYVSDSPGVEAARSTAALVSDRVASTATVGSASSPSVSTGRPFTVGRRHVYGVDYSATFGEASASPLQEAFRYKGELTFVVSDVQPAEVRIEVRFTPEAGSRLGALSHADVRAPFMLSLHPDGAVRAARFVPKTPQEVRTALRAIVGAVQLSNPGGQHWERVEIDSTGEYVARYERKTATHIQRELTGYRRIAGGRQLVPTSAVDDFSARGATSFTLSENGELAGAKGSVRVSFRPVPGSALLCAESRFSLALRSVDTHQAELAWDSLTPAQHLAQSGAARDDGPGDADMEGDTFETLLAKIGKLGELPSSEAATATQALQFKLGTLARHDLHVVHALANALADAAPLEPFAQAVLIGGLAQAHTTEASRSLAVLLDADIDTGRRNVIEAALGQLPADSVVVDALEGQLDSDNETDRTTARLALGNLAGRLDEEQRQEMDPLAGLLAEWDGSADSFDERQALLLAYGNSGDPRVMPHLQEAMAGREPMLREQAIYALRGLPEEVSGGLLRDALAPERAAGDQTAALRALMGRELDPYRDRINALLDTTDNSDVRKLAGQLLGVDPDREATL